MNQRFVLLAIILQLTVCQIQTDPLYKTFQYWQDQYGYSFSPNDEKTKDKFVNFKDNLEHILTSSHLYGEDVELELNQFADMSISEFQSKVLMPKHQAGKFPSSKYLPPLKLNQTLPDSFDWRTKNAVSSVKDQGSVGTCWAFSTVGNIESLYFLLTGIMKDLSVEQLVDCDGTFDIKSGHADCGVFGGWPQLAYQYIINAGGIDSEQEYPYCVGNAKQPCFPCMAPGWNKTLCGPGVEYCNATQWPCKAQRASDAVKIIDWKMVSENEDEIASYLVTQGPLSIALNASWLQFYKSGISNPPFCSKELNHAVLLVGFGEENGKKYWIVKNSWGSKWGENGYFRIIRGVGKCGVNTQVTTAILK